MSRRTSTSTYSEASTFTEARVRAVMEKVHEDLTAFVSCRWVSLEAARRWYDDLTFMLLENIVVAFDFKFVFGGSDDRGIRYEVSDDGTLIEDDESGGMDLYGLPTDMKIRVVVRFSRHPDRVLMAELNSRGWYMGGQCFVGVGTLDRVYSKSGWGVRRYKFGNW